MQGVDFFAQQVVGVRLQGRLLNQGRKLIGLRFIRAVVDQSEQPSAKGQSDVARRVEQANDCTAQIGEA